MSEQELRNWIEQALIVELEHELSAAREEGRPDDVFAQFGKDLPDRRELGPVLRQAIEMARDNGLWADAAIVFRAEMVAQPDYDVPYIWIAEFLKEMGRTQLLIDLLKRGATECRRKSLLLAEAGECALFAGEVRESILLFSQAINAMSGPPGVHDAGRQRPFLFIAELFEGFGDTAGARWARNVQDTTEFDEQFACSIRRAAREVPQRERAEILRDLPAISRHLTALYARKRQQKNRKG